MNFVLDVCLLSERLDEILASQETVLRPKVEDYRAATVKQRPTSRRMTPAEISVRYSMCTHQCKIQYVHTHSNYHKVSHFSCIDQICYLYTVELYTVEFLIEKLILCRLMLV